MNTVIYIRFSTHIDCGIEIFASRGIPRIELETGYLEYFVALYIYKVDGVLRICPISTLRVWTEKKLRIFGVEIFGVEFWSA